MGNTQQVQCRPETDLSQEQHNFNWVLLQQQKGRQILKSKRTNLIIQRYTFKSEIYEASDDQSKVYEWRNNCPNHGVVVSVLSTHREVPPEKSKNFMDCVYPNLCPVQSKEAKTYVVTERILRLGEVSQLISYQKNLAKGKGEAQQKFSPFESFKLEKAEAKRVVQDWVKGIEVLCYKFGYFKIECQNLGITVHKRGNVWINSNFALNSFEYRKQINVSTAQQKFQYEKEVISQIASYLQNIEWFRKFAKQISKNKYSNFEHISSNQAIAQHSENSRQYQSPSHRRNKSSAQQILYSEKDSPLPKRPSLNRGISSPCEQRRVTSAQKIELECIRPSSREFLGNGREGQNYPTNSGSNHVGKETAPTNELWHSSSLNSVQHPPEPLNLNNLSLFNHQNISYGVNQNPNNLSEDTLTKSFTAYQKMKHYIYSNGWNKGLKDRALQKNNQIREFDTYDQKNSSYIEPYMFHSQKSRNNLRGLNPKQNMTFDSGNVVVEPRSKAKLFSNIRREKINLVDSMVMVQEQDFEEELIENGDHSTVRMEESVIIRGHNEAEVPILRLNRALSPRHGV